MPHVLLPDVQTTISLLAEFLDASGSVLQKYPNPLATVL